MRLQVSTILIGMCIGLTPANAQNERYPNRPLTWILNATPGGMVDGSSRAIGRVLGEKLKVPVVIENKPGGGGIVAAEAVAHGKADGYSALWGGSLVLITYPMLFKKTSYDPAKALLPVHGMFFQPMVIVVRKDASFQTLEQLIEYAKRNPGKLNYPSLGKATAGHIAGELLQREANIELAHISYRGTAQMLTDMLGGNLDVMFDFPVAMLPQIEAGKLTALAVTSGERIKQLPNTPTMKEKGYPDSSYVAWGVFAIAGGTPEPIVTTLANAFSESLKDEQVQKYFNDQGAVIMHGYSGAKLKAFMEAERVKMKAILDRAGIGPE